MADETNIDPRFDPAFQRGFEGAVGTTRRRASVGTPSVVPAQETVERPAAIEPVPHPSGPSAQPSVPSPQLADERHREVPTEDGEQSERRRVNPFVLALVVIAIVFIVAGIAGAQFANAAFQTNLTSSLSYVTVLLVIASSAVSAGIGVATLIGIVFLYAARSLRS